MKNVAKMMSLACLCLATTLSGQVQNGHYISDKTTYKDENEPEKSFLEITRNNIYIDFSEEDKTGTFIFEDPRIPNKRLKYSVQDMDIIREGDLALYRFACLAMHLQNPTETEIYIYWNDLGDMQIMILNQLASQVFHDLQKIQLD